MKRLILLVALLLVPGANALNYLAEAHSTSPYMTVYQADGTTFTKLADPATLPTGQGGGTSFSPDESLLAVAHDVSPYVSIYTVSGTTLTKLSNPATLPTGQAFDVDFSDDGAFLAVAHATSPYITIYSVSGTTFTKISDPATLPAGNAIGVDFSPSGDFLAVAHQVSPFVSIYGITGTTFTKLANPGTLPTGTGQEVSFNPDTSMLAVAHTASPFVSIYTISGSTFTKITNPATLPTGTPSGADFSPDGALLALAHATSPYITIYSVSGTTFTKLSDPATLPAGDGYGADFSADGQALAIAHDTTPFLTIYSVDGTTFVKQENPANLPAGNGRGLSFSPNFDFQGPLQIFCAEPLAARFGYNFNEGWDYVTPNSNFETGVVESGKRFRSASDGNNRDYLGLGLDKSSRAYEVHFSIVAAVEGGTSIFKAIFSFEDDIPAVGNKGNAVDTGVSRNSVRVTFEEQGNDWDVELHSVVNGVSTQDDQVDIGDNPNNAPSPTENSFVFVVDTRTGTEEYRIEREDGTVILNAALPAGFVEETIGSQWFVHQGESFAEDYLMVDPDDIEGGTGTSTCVTDLEGFDSLNAPPPSGGGQGGGEDGGTIGDQPFFPGVNVGEVATQSGMSLDQVGWMIGILLIVAFAAMLAPFGMVMAAVGGLGGLGLSIAFGLVPVWFLVFIIILVLGAIVYLRKG